MRVMTNKKVLVFSTRQNLEVLAKSGIWFLDGTFKVCPGIFVQFLLLSVLFHVVKERNKLKMTKMPTKTMPMTPKL